MIFKKAVLKEKFIV